MPHSSSLLSTNEGYIRCPLDLDMDLVDLTPSAYSDPLTALTREKDSGDFSPFWTWCTTPSLAPIWSASMVVATLLVAALTFPSSQLSLPTLPSIPPLTPSTSIQPVTFAAHPFDPVRSVVPCLSPEATLSEERLTDLNRELFAEVDLQLRPKLCQWEGEDVKVHPIIFGIPAENLISCPTVKYRDYAHVIAGRRETYTFTVEDEADYTHSYRIARFAHTRKKAGWDCGRHWEILAAATVPFFVDIAECPEHTLAHLPKSLLLQARYFPALTFHPDTDLVTIDHSLFDDSDHEVSQRYEELQQRIFHFARHRLTHLSHRPSAAGGHAGGPPRRPLCRPLQLRGRVD